MNHTQISDVELNECYNEDTVGRKWRVPIITKRAPINTNRKASEPITMNLNKPMRWNELKTLSSGMQKMYLEHLLNNYNVKRKEIAGMLGITQCTLRRIFHELGLPVGGVGTSYVDTTKKPWDEFIAANETVENTEPIIEEVTEEVVEEFIEDVTIPVETLACDSVKFSITGELNSYDISHKISAMIPDGTPCHISVKISKISDVMPCPNTIGFDSREVTNNARD